MAKTLSVALYVYFCADFEPQTAAVLHSDRVASAARLFSAVADISVAGTAAWRPFWRENGRFTSIRLAEMRNWFLSAQPGTIILTKQKIEVMNGMTSFQICWLL